MVTPFGVARESTRSSAVSGPVSGNSRVPWPTTTGTGSRVISSTSWLSNSQRTRLPLPCTCSSPAGLLGEVSIAVGEGRVYERDHVVTRVNRGGRSPVHNRERWIVEAIDPEARRMTLRHLVETERVVALDAD